MANASSVEDKSFKDSLKRCHNYPEPSSSCFTVECIELPAQQWVSQHRHNNQTKMIISCQAEILPNSEVKTSVEVDEQCPNIPAATSLPPGTYLDSTMDIPPTLINNDLEGPCINMESMDQRSETVFWRKERQLRQIGEYHFGSISHATTAEDVEDIGNTDNTDDIKEIDKDSAYSSRSNDELMVNMVVMFNEREYRWFYKLPKEDPLQHALHRLYLKAQHKLQSITGHLVSFPVSDVSNNDKKLLLYDSSSCSGIDMKITVKQ